MDLYLLSMMNGLAIGLLLFVVASGLSIAFGLLDVLNMAHGSLFIVGAYLASGFAGPSVGSWLLTLTLGAVVGAAGGGLLAVASAPLASRGHLPAALMTLGVSMICAELAVMIWGTDLRSIVPPAVIDGSLTIGGLDYPVYRLALVVVCSLVALVLFMVFERTRVGAIVRATVADRLMVDALGIKTKYLGIGVFALAGSIAVVAGILGAPLFGAGPGLDEQILVLALSVVVVGGLGSMRGALLGALIVGQVQTLGVVIAPSYASFLLFAALALTLAVKPAGLFGVQVRES